MANPLKKSKSDIRNVLSIVDKTPEYQMGPSQKMEIVKDGISRKALDLLKEKAGLDYDQLSKALNVSRTTLVSKKGNEKFSHDVSDKILVLADIYSYGYNVFKDVETFNRWMFRENRALGGEIPFEILNTSFGRLEVKTIITRIEYSVYS